MSAQKQTVEIEGRRLHLTNLDKVLYAETGTTKADIIDYFRHIASVMIPHCRNRPVTRKRWPNGVDVNGEGMMFFQKDIGDGAPDWVSTMPLQHSDHVNVYPLANDLPTLVWFAQLAALELHIPQWRFGNDGLPATPDRIVFDLDPGEGVGLPECAEVAVLIREILQGMGLDPMPVTSGSKGIHLYAPLDGSTSSEHISTIAHELARSLEADHPKEIISTMKRADRTGKVFIDWSQNNEHKTTIAPYSLRGRTRPTVAAPRTWHELQSPKLTQLDLHEVMKLVSKRGDPLTSTSDREQTDSSTKQGEEPEEPPQDDRDRLEVYRSKRDPRRTREPIPEPGEAANVSQAPVFVIQRHDARRLHYDFRLEHEGVLVSWALPRGVPTDPGRNHLAVHTEDHPMEYRFFEGTIPKGEYGGGEVEIWDSGTIEIEKWEHDHVTVTLQGTPDGGLGGIPRRYALFAAGKTEKDWLIHLTKTQPEPNRHAQPDTPQEIPSPMLATLAEEPEITALSNKEWAFETKWDGYRAIAQIYDQTLKLMSRNRLDLTPHYPEITPIATEVELDSVTFDGEIVACNESGITDFSLLQHGDGNINYLIFDVLEINGIDTTTLPYRQRRELLNDLTVPAQTTWGIPPDTGG